MEHDKETQMPGLAVVLHSFTEEILLLRAQVVSLQAGQTAQLIAARHAALECAAEECEAFAYRSAIQCADAIRSLKGGC